MIRAGGRRRDEPGGPAHRSRFRLGRPDRYDLEAYLVIGVALTVGLLGLLDITDPATVAAATLAALGLIVFDMLVGRRHLARLEKDLRDLADTIRTSEGSGSADRLLTHAEPGSVLREVEAKDIRMVGVTLNRTLRSHLHLLERQLAAGGSVRVAVIDPAGAGPAEAARRNGLVEETRVFEHRLAPTMDLLHYLAASGAGRLEVRLLPFVPAFGLVMVDPDGPTGRVCVDIYSHRPDGQEAVLTLRAGGDSHWYQHFVKEFDRIWAAGRPVPVERVAR